jgi:hypothetical protein
MPETRSDRIAPVRKSITVPWKPAAAFRRFTDGIAEWWPLASHSVSESEEAGVTFEGRVGGRLDRLGLRPRPLRGLRIRRRASRDASRRAGRRGSPQRGIARSVDPATISTSPVPMGRR